VKHALLDEMSGSGTRKFTCAHEREVGHVHEFYHVSDDLRLIFFEFDLLIVAFLYPAASAGHSLIEDLARPTLKGSLHTIPKYLDRAEMTL